AALAWSPDGKTLATSGHDRSVRLWEGDPLRLTRELSTSGIGLLAWSADGERLAVGGFIPGTSEAANVELLDGRTGIKSAEIRGGAEDLAWSKSNLLAIGRNDGLAFWDPAKDKVSETNLRRHVTSLAWTDQGRLAVAYSSSGDVYHGKSERDICV